MRAHGPVLGVLVVVLGVTGCGGSGGGTAASGAAASGATSTPAAGGGAAGGAVEVKSFAFTPPTVTVPAGSTVTWTFADTAAHNVRAADGTFTSPDLTAGKTYQQKFPKAGTYKYLCGIHQYMTGTVTVT